MTGLEVPILIAATAAQAVSSFQQDMAAAEASEFNARLAQRNAQAARDRAAFEEARLRREQERFLSTQRTQIAAAGVSLEGSPLELRAETASEFELDALTLRFTGAAQAQDFETRAAFGRARARQQRVGAVIGAGTALLSGAARVASLPGPAGSGGTPRTTASDPSLDVFGPVRAGGF